MTIDWSTWKPGDTDAEFIASAPGWLAEGLRNQKISFPGADSVQLDAVAKIVALGLGSGSAESKTVKEVVSQLSIDKDLAKSLTHFAMALAMCQRALGEYEYAKGAKIQWDSAGCCDKCNQNDGTCRQGNKHPHKSKNLTQCQQSKYDCQGVQSNTLSHPFWRQPKSLNQLAQTKNKTNHDKRLERSKLQNARQKRQHQA